MLLVFIYLSIFYFIYLFIFYIPYSLIAFFFPLIAFCNPILSHSAFAYSCYVIKNFQNSFKENNTPYTSKQPLMMAFEGFESARDNFGKFIHQLQPETKTFIKKLKRILNKLYTQNVSLLFNETYIYIYMFH